MNSQNQITGNISPENGLIACALEGLYDLSITHGKGPIYEHAIDKIVPADALALDPVAYILMLAGCGGTANLSALSQNERSKPDTPEEILGFIWNSPYVQQKI